MRKFVLIISTCLLISFFMIEFAFATHRAGGLYACPSAVVYKQHLISGKTLKLCPIGRSHCKHQVWMSAYLRYYAGYPPKRKWHVKAANGYKHKQCHYIITINDKKNKTKTLPGYLLIKSGGLTKCHADKLSGNRFTCKANRKKS